MKYERQDDCQSVTWATHSDWQTFNPMVNDRTACISLHCGRTCNLLTERLQQAFRFEQGAVFLRDNTNHKHLKNELLLVCVNRTIILLPAAVAFCDEGAAESSYVALYEFKMQIKPQRLYI